MQKSEKQTIKMNKERGITLVALVITIIVLLILAGITISSIFGDSGIIKNATEAQILTELSNVKEALELYKITNYSHGDMSDEELVEEGLLKEVFIKDTYRTVAVITDLEKIEIKSKLGKGGAKQENTEEETLLDMYNVYGVDMADGTLYYIRDGVWSIEGEKVTYTASTGEEKEGYVVETINGQYLEDRKFITQWTVEAGTTITLPITSAPDITIEWGSDEDGDGELDVETCTTVQPTNTYANAGTYTIKISGTMKKWNFQQVATSKDYITQIVQWGNTKIENLNFSGCSNLEGTIPSHKTDNEFSNLGEATKMFYKCSNLTGSIPEDLFKNAEKIAWGSFRYCFEGCSGLTGSIPENLFADSPNAEMFDYVFAGCTGLTGQIPSGLLKNNTKVTNVREMFRECTGISGKIPEGLFSNCPKITNLYRVFSGTSITEIPVNLFDINNGQPNGIKDLGGVFEKTKITTVPADLFDLCTSVEEFGTSVSYGGIFQGCTLLETIPANLFAKNTEVTTFGNAFNGCSSLKEIPDGLFYNNTKVTQFSGVFAACTSLKEIPENTFNTSESVSIGGAFSGCASLTRIGKGIFESMPNINAMNHLFNQCTSLTEVEGLYIPDGITNIQNIFHGCKNLTTIPNNLVIPASVTNMAGAFYWCANLNATITLKSNQVTNNKTFTRVNSNFRLNWASPCTEEMIDEILANAERMDIKGVDVTETE